MKSIQTKNIKKQAVQITACAVRSFTAASLCAVIVAGCGLNVLAQNRVVAAQNKKNAAETVTTNQAALMRNEYNFKVPAAKTSNKSSGKSSASKNAVSGSSNIAAQSLIIGKAPLDYNGDGRTDYALARSADGASQTTWFVMSSAGNSLVQTGAEWGLGVGTVNAALTDAVDIAVPADYDGDKITDIAVWRAVGYKDQPVGAPTRAYFYILNSSTNTFRSEQFGTEGDDPTIVGDYDGDGKADPAVFRENPADSEDGSPAFWYYRASSGAANNIRGTQWGFTGDYPAPGDYDGDGKADFVVQREVFVNDTETDTTGVFYLNKTKDGFETAYYGNGLELNVPGDYDGDGKTDIAVRRSINGIKNFFIRNSSNGATQFYQFGRGSCYIESSSTGALGDCEVPGDYNGDGKTDIAVWRPEEGIFYIRPNGSTTAAADYKMYWGSAGDIPAAFYNVH